MGCHKGDSCTGWKVRNKFTTHSTKDLRVSNSNKTLHFYLESTLHQEKIAPLRVKAIPQDRKF